MGTYRGNIRLSGVVERPLDICIDLDHRMLAMRSPEGGEIGQWPLEIVQITGRDEGFTFQINGFPAWVRTDDDGAFANEVGLRWAPPRLRRLMAISGRPAERHAALS